MGEVDRNRLQYFLDKVGNDPDLLAEDVYGKKIPLGASTKPYRTFCNLLVERVCQAMDYDNLFGLNADQIFDYCTQNWIRVPEAEAMAAAMLGDLVIAAWKNPDPEGHGHVAMCYPVRQMIPSGKWGSMGVPLDCPQVASVDRVIPCGANYAFLERPQYFRLGRVMQ